MQINQFHSGTAPGDAITNEMLAIRDMLVAAGYESQVYAEQVAPELAGEIHPIARYEGSAGNALLVHHSMGIDCHDRIIGLPDHKVLVYHNITPAEYFEHDPFIASYVEKGRAQLLAYREHVAFAFANSEYTRRELESLGFGATATLPVTFGLDALHRTPPNAELLATLAPTTNILFVGRIVPNKKQDDLIRTLAYYRQNVDRTARLFLVGGFDHVDRYYQQLRWLAAENGLDGAVAFPGKVRDEDLVAYYRTASAYLSMSEHEGFGVPLVESMMFDVPVLAYKASAVPFTLGDAGLVFRRKDIPLVAELVATVVHDDHLRDEVLEAQRLRLEELRPQQFLAGLIETVERICGSGSPGPAIGSRIQIQGPFETTYSLAVTNRGLARALDRLPGADVSLYAAEGPGPGPYTPRAEDLADKPDVERLWQKSLAGEPPDYVIRNMYPPRVSDVDASQLNFFYFYWEDSLIPAEYADSFNRHLDGLLVATRHVRSVLLNSGVAIPIEIVGAGVEAPGQAIGDVNALRLDTVKSFKFLHVSSGFPRKGCDVLLRAYAAEFSADDDVCLIVKTFPNIHNTVAQQIEELRQRGARCPEIVHIDGDLPPDAMAALYRSASCLVHPARAEGFGLPVAEAMLERVPVIATNYSGLTDFCSEATALLVDFRLVPSGSHFGVEGAEWAEPDEEQLRRQMRSVYEDRSSAPCLAMAERAFQNIRDNFTWDRVARRALGFMRDVEQRARRPIRAGMVTTWNSRCGIAEYAKHLAEATAADDVDWTILAAAEETVEADTPIVIRCWQDRWHGDLSRVLDETERLDLDAVQFQFNFGFFELHDLSRAISRLKGRGRRVFLTLHSTKDVVIDGENVSLGQIASSLKEIDRILVHSEEDRRRLAAWGIQANVTRLPHGFLTFPDEDREEIRRDIGISGSPIVATFGFALPHKGLLETIDALGILVERHPEAMLMAFASLHPDPRSRAYYEQCRGRVRELSLERHCKIITEFLKPHQIVTGLQASDVVVLPYHETNESSSASVRLPLASHRPVITTRQPVFDDVCDVVHPIAASTPATIAEAIVQLLGDPALVGDLVARADQRVANDGWHNVAKMQSKILRGACLR